MRKIPGITRAEEEENLRDTINAAEEKVASVRQNAAQLRQELHAMQEEFDSADKELQALWHNTDDMFRHVTRELGIAVQARRKPYFGRIDFTDKKSGQKEAYYIGRSVVARNPAEPMVIDWRAPIAGVYYGSSLGSMTYSVKGEGRYEIDLTRKRTYEIEEDRLKDFYDSDVVANDELLTKYLARNKKAVLGEIIATIQQEQNDVIRRKPQHNLIIQGAAGSGKTTVAMHRISYILYNYEQEFAPEDFYIIGSNQVLLNYITGVLPELNVYGVRQMTMEQLFVRLLYEAWESSYRILPVQRGITPPFKGTYGWFCDLERYCDAYERKLIPRKAVILEKNGEMLLSAEEIERIWERSSELSRADKITRLTEHLMAKLENELSGKYYSYTKEEKKQLTRYYSTYFGKREWKGDIYEVYEEFLRAQSAKGLTFSRKKDAFDVYDLAALAYLYKRLQEKEIIREAGHVVIDEAQDFGMMAYASLKRCLSTCTYTIMGDVSQNISMDYGLNDWEELRSLMLTDSFDCFGLLKKSYRNTIEIARFASDILCHGSFYSYPSEPIIRHGNAVEVRGVKGEEELVSQTEIRLKKWLEQGYETIAVICASEKQAEELRGKLQGRVELSDVTAEQIQLQEGVMILTLPYTKGLEFDAVLIYDASDRNYPVQDAEVKRLYVAATRALHELTVLYQGRLTELIGVPVTEEQRKKCIMSVPALQQQRTVFEEEKTNEELYRERAAEGEKERKRRDKYGPKRIVVVQNKEKLPENTAAAAGREKLLTKASRTGTEKLSPKYQSLLLNPPKKQVKELPSYLERQKKELQQRNGRSTAALGEFGEMPEERMLRPAGHGRIDCSVRFVMKGKDFYDFMSSYGTLRITPVSPELIRVCFCRGQGSRFPKQIEKHLPQIEKHLPQCGVSSRFRETAAAAELLTGELRLRIDKKSGALSFFNSKGDLLLQEREKEPRQIAEGQSLDFLSFAKTETLTAQGGEGVRPIKIGMSARYISHGRECEKLAVLTSDRGYALYFPAGVRTLCCNIPMYGAYVAEESEIIDFYFRLLDADSLSSKL